jgi:hypothetical protein
MTRRATHVLLATAILVGGANAAAYAATGDPLLGGKSNATERATTLENTGPGPALKLKNGPGAAPLAVSSAKKVANLNADQIDGLDSKDLRTRAFRYEVAAEYAEHQVVSFPKLPPGIYQASYSLFSRGISSPSPILCYLDSGRIQAWSASTFTGAPANFYSNNASVIVDTRAQDVTLHCSSSDDFRMVAEQIDVFSEVTFTRVDTFTTRTADVAAQP